MHLRDGKEISDIEALAGAGDEILVFASHSRNTSCEVKPKRHQFAKVSLSKAQTAIVGTLRSKKVTCEHLFDNPALGAPMKAACEAIDTADAKATQIDDAMKAGKFTEDAAKALCNEVNAYNAEGAVGIHTPKGTDVWIGLRACQIPRSAWRLCATSCRNTACQGIRTMGKGLRSPSKRFNNTPRRMVAGE